MTTTQRIRITPEGVWQNGQQQVTKACGAALLTALYRERVSDYPKFFKMDELCKLGFVAAELLLQAAGERPADGNGCRADGDDRAVVLFGSSGSTCNDHKYQQTIRPGDYFPSPALFVYTLPNIVTGEIAIRNRYHGETAFYVLAERDDRLMDDVFQTVFADGVTTSIIGGWVDYTDADHFEADLFLIEK